MRSGSTQSCSSLRLPSQYYKKRTRNQDQRRDPFSNVSPYASHPFALSADSANGRQKSEVTCSVHPTGRKRDLIRRPLKREISHDQVQDGLFFFSPGADRAGANPHFPSSLFFAQALFSQFRLSPFSPTPP